MLLEEVSSLLKHLYYYYVVQSVRIKVGQVVYELCLVFVVLQKTLVLHLAD